MAVGAIRSTSSSSSIDRPTILINGPLQSSPHFDVVEGRVIRGKLLLEE
jgi:hypothetical protein